MTGDPSRRRLIAANWKMHETISEATGFVDKLLPRIAGVESVDVVICPAYPALGPTVELTRGSGVQVFAQNMHYAAQGPFTGEVSAPMLLEAGVRGVILGHSERRRLFAESDETVQLKTAAAVGAGLVPILCVGETEQECELGETERRLHDQLQAGLALVDTGRLGEVVIAYEPRWTIGTGRLAAPAHVQLVGAFLRALVADRSCEQAARVRVLYGGSITPESAAALLELDEVDGLLVGEASLRAESFAAIVDAARRLSTGGRGRPR
ncbi:MAG: triose-phosphate isomerase [Blastococcus sp.]